MSAAHRLGHFPVELDRLFIWHRTHLINHEAAPDRAPPGKHRRAPDVLGALGQTTACWVNLGGGRTYALQQMCWAEGYFRGHDGPILRPTSKQARSRTFAGFYFGNSGPSCFPSTEEREKSSGEATYFAASATPLCGAASALPSE